MINTDNFSERRVEKNDFVANELNKIFVRRKNNDLNKKNEFNRNET
jgi:hypothetical protein